MHAVGGSDGLLMGSVELEPVARLLVELLVLTSVFSDGVGVFTVQVSRYPLMLLPLLPSAEKAAVWYFCTPDATYYPTRYLDTMDGWADGRDSLSVTPSFFFPF